MPTISMKRTAVGDANQVGKTVVVETIEQVMRAGGPLAGAECAAGALAAAVGALVVALDEAAARRVVASAVEVAVQYLADEARKAAH